MFDREANTCDSCIAPVPRRSDQVAVDSVARPSAIADVADGGLEVHGEYAPFGMQTAFEAA